MIDDRARLAMVEHTPRAQTVLVLDLVGIGVCTVLDNKST